LVIVPGAQIRNPAVVKILLSLSFVGMICSNASAAQSERRFTHPDMSPASGWKAAWIGVAEPATSNQWIAFRKTFVAGKVSGPAIGRVAADSKYWLWLNGEMIVREGGLKRGPTPSDTYFDELDLSGALQPGTNTLAVLLWHFGKEGFSHKSSGKAGLLFQLDHEEATLRSDATWRARIHPAFGNTGAPHPNYRLPESNIRFDATQDIAGWGLPGFDDSSWANAVVFGPAPGAPWHQLVKRPVPLWKDYGLTPYANAAELPRVSDGKTIKARLPYNAQVTPYFKIAANAGQVIKIQTDNYRGGSEPNVRAEYVTRAGEQEFEFPGWMNGHAVHYDIPAGARILDLQFRESGFATEFAGTFNCDNDFLNRLRTKAVRTLYITMRDTYMDCPDRERALWWGDAVNELGEAFYALDRRADTLARKSILELIGWQKPDGVLFAPIPTGNWDKDLPLQMLASIGRPGFWTYGLYSGDTNTLRAVYPGVKWYLEIWDMQTNGLVVQRPGGWPWGDWGDNVDMTVLYNAWYHLALQGMEQMALTLNFSNDLPWIAQRQAAIEGAFNQTFWNGQEYRAPDHKGKTDDRANALAVVAGLAKPEQFPALLEVLKTQEHASPYMEKYVLEALCLMNEPAQAQARMQKRYAKMVNHPEYTTLWEGWGIGAEGFGGGTINHAWSGGPLTIMSQYFAGIAPTSLGFATYQVKPQMGALTNLSAKVVTVRGDISVAVRNLGPTFVLSLSSPPGTVATVGIPMLSGARWETVMLNGKPIWRSGKGRIESGMRQIQPAPGWLEIEMNPGEWEFVATPEAKAN
jgi:alpha-L-rhamnosidase